MVGMADERWRRTGHLFTFVRNAWLYLGITLLLLLGLELAGRAAYFVRGLGDSQTSGAPRWMPEAYRSAAWFPEYRDEFRASNRTEWHSYVYWRRMPYEGNHINIDSLGYRHTTNPIEREDANLEVFVFGGSTVWGSGARDPYTIPSHMSRQLNDVEGIDAYVVNLGESGWVSTQGLVQLVLEIRRGHIPDVAVFYDGVNEVTSAFQTREAGLTINEARRRADFGLNQRQYELRPFEWLVANSKFATGLISVRNRIMPQARPTPTHRSPAGRVLAREVVDTYLANLSMIDAICRQYGIDAYYVWQPVVHTKRVRSETEGRIFESLGPRFTSFWPLVYGDIAARPVTPPNFHNLEDVFGTDTETRYIDAFHLTEEGNGIVAERIVELITAAADSSG